MSKIKIKNFDPIKQGYQQNDGWIDLKKITVFVGNQGSGKSTVAKLISTFVWIEKALVRGDTLSTYEGIPSDTNYLNENLKECNQLFDSILEIEEEL